MKKTITLIAILITFGIGLHAQTVPKAGISGITGSTYPASDTVKSTSTGSKSYTFTVAGHRDLLGIQANVGKYGVNALSGYVTLYESIDTGATYSKIVAQALVDSTAGIYRAYYISYNWNQAYQYKITVNTAAADSFVVRMWKIERN